MTLTGILEDHENFHVASDLVDYVSCPYVYRRPEGMSVAAYCDHLVDELEEKIVTLGPENVAAFIAEPIMGSGGVIVPPEGYHRRTLEVCKKYDVLYISDEVVTGFGRLGHWFASESLFDLTPDIITSAKGITSGYLPLGATLISDRIHEVISSPEYGGDNTFYHGFTYSGHPVVCAAGLTNMAIMEKDGILAHVREMGPYFQKQLESLLDLPIVGDVRGSHFMLGVECVADKETKALIPAEADIARRIAHAAEKRGLIVRPLGHIIILSPPLILTRQEIDELVEKLRESILEVTEGLIKEKGLG